MNEKTGVTGILQKRFGQDAAHPRRHTDPVGALCGGRRDALAVLGLGI
ncbi:MAG TPA: hypothetical protein PLR20_07570 [Syntrophales bacterium]|nr:hypothetical protein [Syntrophales bacterium]HOX93317.1 hypothetical protein [Syntrophales bacterium]HPI56518.1 hypothetical protein [Syntrophales bacterium]HPN25061.1 hypothetical protein [Syntrophales bacterium]HQM29196.1 hypothetical protein [Syntrophales bacterium]